MSANLSAGSPFSRQISHDPTPNEGERLRKGVGNVCAYFISLVGPRPGSMASRTATKPTRDRCGRARGCILARQIDHRLP